MRFGQRLYRLMVTGCLLVGFLGGCTNLRKTTTARSCDGFGLPDEYVSVTPVSLSVFDKQATLTFVRIMSYVQQLRKKFPENKAVLELADRIEDEERKIVKDLVLCQSSIFGYSDFSL